MTGNNPRHAILVPGADALTFEEDRAAAEARHISVHELTLPPFSGHPIDHREAHFNAVADLIAAKLSEIRALTPAAAVAAVGRNNGGGQLSWAAARGLDLDAVVLVGAIPEISLYRMKSDSPSAQQFRNTLKSPDEFDRIPEMRHLDIVTTAFSIPADVGFHQLGRNDPYIDFTAEPSAERIATHHRVEWYPDDHAMVAPATLAARWDFIESRLRT